jgi:hypothetical protein
MQQTRVFVGGHTSECMYVCVAQAGFILSVRNFHQLPVQTRAFIGGHTGGMSF